MKLIRIANALAPNGSRGRHEAPWRPLPAEPGRRRHLSRRPPAHTVHWLGAVTAITLVGSMVAVAAPSDGTEPGFVTTPPAVVVEADRDPLPVEAPVELTAPEATVHTWETETTIADPEYSVERLSTTTTTAPPPDPEAVAAAEVEAADLVRRVQSMTARGFEEEIAVQVDEFPGDRPLPATGAECRERARERDLAPDGSWDRTAIARMTWSLFDCVLSLHGLDEVAPSSVRGWDGSAVGFESLAEQMAAEAVVVSYCESIGYRHSALTGTNGFGYGGLFQMGATEMRRFGAGGSRFDPVDNAYGAVNYVWYQYANRNGWGGWSPWAVVNTNFNDEINDRVKVPVLPRFRSTDPEFRGRQGPQLPEWAVNPWLADVPSWRGCPHNGGRW